MGRRNNEPSPRSHIMLAGLTCVAVVIVGANMGDLLAPYEGRPLPFNIVTGICAATFAVGLDWAGISRFIETWTAYGEEEPRYRDYAKGRLAVIVLAALICLNAAHVACGEWTMWLGIGLGIGAHLYGYVAVFRDLKNPPDRLD